MTPQEFVSKWSGIQLKETAASQSHFNDICRLIEHPTPVEYDRSGENFSFETQTVKPGGRKGFADVYFRDHFIWEYKGPHKDLERAYRQLQLYREALDNPPLLITSDLHTIEIHTNFTNYPTRKYVVTFEDMLEGDGVELLRDTFFDPTKLRPDKTQAQITKATADTFVRVADGMKDHRRLMNETYSAEELAHFLVRLLFCLFAEDMGLLPEGIFTEIVRTQGGNYAELQPVLQKLFTAMRDGGTFGWYSIRHFNGTLFDDDFVPTIPYDLGNVMLKAAEQDWAQIEPSIFGTLFERIMDEEKRAQLGAQYTGEDDIMLIVKPVLMEPLEKKWDEVRRQADRILRQPNRDETHIDQAYQLLADFSAKIASLRVLDPASGSGNFLYISLRELLNLQKRVIAYAAGKGLPAIELTVSPEQLFGIEINTYAHELAQITSWIGYLQWRNENGFGEMADPILRPLHNIKLMDAILAYDENGNPIEPEWPDADVIVGNPPFIGDKKKRTELGDRYVDDLHSIYSGLLPGSCDLVCHWFEKARSMLEQEVTSRVGLLATQGIRGGSNRVVIDRIKATGDIFWAMSDRNWILDGATVHVSMIGFDNGKQVEKSLNGHRVLTINSDLTSSLDLTAAESLPSNKGIAYQGPGKVGDFDIPDQVAQKMLQTSKNSAVIKPYMTGRDILNRNRGYWLIDFGQRSEEEAAKYEEPFLHVINNVKPSRIKNRDRLRRTYWWRLGRSGKEYKNAVARLSRQIFTSQVAKHRVFVWVGIEIMPANTIIAFAREDDYFFGMLHSIIHELWARPQGTQLRDAQSGSRYTPTTSFETFPFPWPPGQEPLEQEDERVAEIAYWARELVAWRGEWLNPPPPPSNVIDTTYKKRLKQRTLTNLYNGLVYFRDSKEPGKLWSQDEFEKVTRKSVTRSEIQELDDIHRALDEAVLDAYGWPHDLSDEEILERLLALNLERHEELGR